MAEAFIVVNLAAAVVIYAVAGKQLQESNQHVFNSSVCHLNAETSWTAVRRQKAAAAHQLTPCSVTSVPLSAVTSLALLIRSAGGGVPTGEASAQEAAQPLLV